MPGPGNIAGPALLEEAVFSMPTGPYPLSGDCILISLNETLSSTRPAARAACDQVTGKKAQLPLPPFRCMEHGVPQSGSKDAGNNETDAAPGVHSANYNVGLP